MHLQRRDNHIKELSKAESAVLKAFDEKTKLASGTSTRLSQMFSKSPHEVVSFLSFI